MILPRKAQHNSVIHYAPHNCTVHVIPYCVMECDVEPSTLAMRMANPIACFKTYDEADDVEGYFEPLDLFSALSGK